MQTDSWVVRVDWTAAAPLDEADGIALVEQLSDLRPGISIDAEDGDAHQSLILRIPTRTLREAIATGLQRAEAATGIKADGVEGMTRAQEARNYERSILPHLIGMAEVAEIVGVSTERAAIVVEREDFPPPALDKDAGPLWFRWEVEYWVKLGPLDRMSREEPSAGD